jgi:hypothetical protein
LGLFKKILGCFGLFWIVSVCDKTDLFVLVVSIYVRNTKTNQNFFVFGFTKQTETNRNKRETDLVSVCFGSNEIYFYLFRGHPNSSSSARGLTLIGVLLTLAGREGQWQCCESGMFIPDSGS